MEKQLDEQIKEFLAVSSGYGYGSGSGSGYGSGYGYGYGDGDGSGSGSGYGYGYGDGDGSGSGSGYGYGYGSGSGDGDGYGDGDGSGSGSGIPEFNGQKVYMIDGVPTLIDSVLGNHAKGSILNNDFTLTPVYIARVGDFFAHGETLREAYDEASEKYNEKMPLEDRIFRFRNTFLDPDSKLPVKELYRWHHILTGSCKAGRNAFAREHSIDIENGQMTVREFINLTKDSYGSDAIRQLAEAYGISINDQNRNHYEK